MIVCGGYLEEQRAVIMDAGSDLADGKYVRLQVVFELADGQLVAEVGHLSAVDTTAHTLRHVPARK